MSRRYGDRTVALVIAVILASTMTACSSRGEAAHSTVSGPSSTKCNDSVDATKPYVTPGVASATSGLRSVATDFAVGVVAGQGYALIAAGQHANWLHETKESPAIIERLSGSDGKVLKRISLSADKLNQIDPVAPGQPGIPVVDKVSSIAVGKDKIYAIWARYGGISGITVDTSLLALDSCSLAVVAIQPISVSASQDQNRVAYDSVSDTVWVPGTPNTGEVTQYNGISLSLTNSVTVNDIGGSCIVAANGLIWYSLANSGVSTITPSTGAVNAVIPDSTASSYNCVQTDGKNVYQSNDLQLVLLDSSGAPIHGYPLHTARVAGIANGKTWAIAGDGVTSLNDLKMIHVGLISSAATTTMNVWVVTFDGALSVI